MFFKYVTLFLAFTASAIAGAIQSGTYRITNVATQSTVRANETDSKIYVSSTKEDSQFELWDVKETNDGGYTLKNLAWADYAAPSFSSLGSVTRSFKFSIESVGNEYLIKVPHHDLFWTVESPITPSGDVKLRHADRIAKQRWTFTTTDSA